MKAYLQKLTHQNFIFAGIVVAHVITQLIDGLENLFQFIKVINQKLQGEKEMRSTIRKLNATVNEPFAMTLTKIFLLVGIMLIATNVEAKDLMPNTMTDALDTMKGSGRSWAYIIDGAISLGAFAKTKNPFVFFSVLAVAIAMTVITGMAGG
jgi:hypothetical protein